MVANCTRILNIVDTEAPVITLNGSMYMTIQGGDAFPDPGATAFDKVDGYMIYNSTARCPVTVDGVVQGSRGIICRIVIINGELQPTLDTRQVANLTILYAATDTSGHVVLAYRYVTLIDTKDPSLNLTGPSFVRVPCGQRYIDQGATSFDAVDGNLTSRIRVLNPIDVRFAMSAPITYSVTDNTGHQPPSIQRVVQTYDDSRPSITLLGAPVITVEGATPYREPFALAYDALDGDITYLITMDVRRISNLPGTAQCNKSTGCVENGRCVV